MKTSHLPAIVAPLADAPIRHNFSVQSTRNLATELYDVPDDRLPHVMAAINGAGVMFCQLWLRTAIWIGMRKNGTTRTQAWFAFLTNYGAKFGQDKLMEMLTEMRHGTVEHILRGKDREDENSVGGLSKREMQAVNNILAVSRRYETRIAVYEAAAFNQKHGG